MHYTWLGIVTGVIAIGIATLIGLTIIHGGALVMQRENWELARVLIPAIVSVLGWLVTIWWALRHVEISSEKNRALQYEMLQSNEQLKIKDSVIVAFVEINKSLSRIERYLQNLRTNIEFKKQGKNNPALVDIFHSANEAYSELFEGIDTLGFNLVRLQSYQLSIGDSLNFIQNIQTCFSGDSVWYSYQEYGAAHLQQEDRDTTLLFEAIDKISINCSKLSSDALKAVRTLAVQKA